MQACARPLRPPMECTLKPFSTLLDRLIYSPEPTAKRRLLQAYFRATPDPDRGWALAILTDNLPLSFPISRTLGDLVSTRLDPELYRLSRDYVGDTAETVALLWPDPSTPTAALRLADVMATLHVLNSRTREKRALRPQLETWLDQLDAPGRWALLKLVSGGLRVGVSPRLVKTALADTAGQTVDVIEEVWHDLDPPYTALFDWLAGRGPRPAISGAHVFRSPMLAHPLEAHDFDVLDVDALQVEWKWDGVRVQLAAARGDARLYTRTGDDIGRAFPDLVGAVAFDAVLDGELLIVRDGVSASYTDLQKRLTRKTASVKMQAQFPAHLRIYDALFLDGEDLRGLPLNVRRQRLEAWFKATRPARMDLSEIIAAPSREALREIWTATRGQGIDGMMLKRRDSAYVAGRPRDLWWKWKHAAQTLDCVLMYVQKSSGKQSPNESDYTFGVWTTNDDGTRVLVPVGKAWSGITDAERLEIDRWIRAHTLSRYGPVRAVEPGLVFEVAFDAVQQSSRHKSGVALRRPRIDRIRWDKPADDADTIEAARALIIAV
jgi:DNA ligase 1